MAVRYDVARGPASGPQPGTVALRDHWRRVTGLGDLGIFNPRRVRGARAWSVHAEGRAFDGAANAHDPAQKALADRYVAFLIAAAEDLHIQQIIWNRRIWRSGRGWRAYSGASPHTDHVHVEQNRTGAAAVTAQLLDRCWSDFDTTVSPQEDHDMPELRIIDAFADWLGRPPAPAEMSNHMAYVAFHGLVAAVLNIATSPEATGRRKASASG